VKLISIVLVTVLASVSGAAELECTKAPREKWKTKAEFRKSLIERGFDVKVLRITPGNCYEVYGWDKAEAKVEMHFNPVTGEVVKESTQ
jgi:hypothetical protein